MILMRILIYGAGVIGSLYAVLFAEAGYDTSVYARGKRLEFLKKNGLLYKKNQNIRRAEATILGELSDNDAYDFILLTVRENQLYEALAELKNNKSNIIVTMVNSLDRCSYSISGRYCWKRENIACFSRSGRKYK